MRSKRHLAALFTAFALVAKAGAAIIYFPNEDIPIPTDFAGVSVDFETGATSNSLGGLADGDANFFFGGAELSNDADAAVSTPSWQPVRAGTGFTDIVVNLPVNTPVDAASTYHVPVGSQVYGSSGDVTPHFPEFTAGTSGYIGFSMVPNAGGALVYGWAEVTFQNDGVTPGTIHSWAYESDPGVSIAVGAIPEPGSAALALLGLSGLLLRRRRR